MPQSLQIHVDGLTRTIATNAPDVLLNPISATRRRLGGISNARFYELVKEGRIHLTKLGRRSFVTEAELHRFVASLGVAA
jgi:hypothetical protein